MRIDREAASGESTPRALSVPCRQLSQRRLRAAYLVGACLSVLFGSAVLAGPTTTTTTEPTTTTSTTTTTTTTTTSTTTTEPTTTTTVATTTTTSSTTTTTLPSGLSGQYSFLDKATGSANTSFMNVDTGLGELCVAGQTAEVANGQSIAPTVTFTYQALGDITDADDKTVKADFLQVLLTLDITGPDPDNSSGTITRFNQTILLECKLDASLRKEGDADKVKLRCELGENFSEFDGLTSGDIVAIDSAYKSAKRAKASSKNGKLKITHEGEPTEGVGLTCDLD